MKINRYLTRYADFTKVMLAGVVNTFGDCFDQLATSWLVLELTGSGYWFAFNFAVNALPNLVIQPILGVLIERMSKKKVMIIADIARGSLVIGLIVLYLNQMLPPYLVLVFSFLMTSFEAFRQPAAMSLAPYLVDKEDYDQTTSIQSSTKTIANIAGTAIAGIVIASAGITAALWVDVVSFGLSAFILMFLKTDVKKETSEGVQYFDELKDGWHYFLNHSFFFKLSFVTFFINLLLAGFNVLMLPFAVEVLKQDASYVSLFQTIMLIAMLGGTWLFPKLHKKLSSQKLFVVSGLLYAFSLLIYATLPFHNHLIIGTTIAAALIGFGSGIIPTVLSVTFMTTVDRDKFARVAAFFNSFAYAASPVGSLVIAGLMVFMEMSQILILVSVLLLVLFIVFYKDRSFSKM